MTSGSKSRADRLAAVRGLRARPAPAATPPPTPPQPDARQVFVGQLAVQGTVVRLPDGQIVSGLQFTLPDGQQFTFVNEDDQLFVLAALVKNAADAAVRAAKQQRVADVDAEAVQ